MGDKSAIQWTEATWNPTVGCTHVSAGCDHCYAAREASGRLARLPLYQGLAADGKFTGEVRLVPERLDQPLRWRRPRRIFVDSMSDLFHPAIPLDYLARVFAVMALARRHTFQVLTKRPARMASLLSRETFVELVEHRIGDWDQDYLTGWPIPNVWLGTSVEDQRAADERIPKLLVTPAAVRFLSCEPLLGPLDLEPYLTEHEVTGWNGDAHENEERPALHWVIVGGESGAKARPMHPLWAIRLRADCAEAGVAFFMKQFGAWRWCYEADSITEERAARARGDGAYLEHEWRSLELDGTFVDGPPTETCVTVSRYGGHNGDPAGWPADLRVREYPRQEVTTRA